MSAITVTVAGVERSVTEGTTYGELLEADGRTVIAARAESGLKDLAAVVAEGGVVEPVEIGSDDGRAIMRHSAAHVMAQAVQELFPEAKLGIGPPVEQRLLLRLRRQGAVHARRPQARREAHARDRQAGADLLPPGRLRRRGPGGAGGGAVQARTDRPQGRRRPE